jgi:hypothetical protein
MLIFWICGFVEKMRICDLGGIDQNIIFLILREHTVAEMATVLDLRVNTLKKRLARLYYKLQVRSKIGVVKRFYAEKMEDLTLCKS